MRFSGPNTTNTRKKPHAHLPTVGFSTSVDIRFRSTCVFHVFSLHVDKELHFIIVWRAKDKSERKKQKKRIYDYYWVAPNKHDQRTNVFIKRRLIVFTEKSNIQIHTFSISPPLQPQPLPLPPLLIIIFYAVIRRTQNKRFDGKVRFAIIWLLSVIFIAFPCKISSHGTA